jgi:hypothetical protein
MRVPSKSKRNAGTSYAVVLPVDLLGAGLVISRYGKMRVDGQRAREKINRSSKLAQGRPHFQIF